MQRANSEPGSQWARASATVIAVAFLTISSLSGCAGSEPVGYSKTTTKTVNDTPTEKTTVTETREKNTTITPR
ncbi:MAG: hypothetical protein JNK16_05730 [Phycisphaerales bacterium]|nr:hypothetical protein [Phycisphaerales bacterium]